ncbi:hypothetical protein CALVIDRAFT_535265 [Calocera viscosa TUFC12733]|uniref:Oxidoreductase-like domain-containing protein n=1 Tax=Calocera viscosa (strain TUFC12733) TaxID=1330018 RepID=A0A167PCZ7_CALVF|nr:hypothetical protein CALVIDRAFT_535265 [Calocera viscosa TUFC12733]
MKDPIPAQIPSVRSPGQGLKETPKRVLRGIELPERPIPPASDGAFIPLPVERNWMANSATECCMGGCAVCVYDLYSEAVEEYHADLATARTKLLASDVPKDLWPNDVLESGQDGKSVGNKAKDAVDDEIDRLDASLKAFLAMERALKKKRVGANEGRAG